jgi:hypothetical protein
LFSEQFNQAGLGLGGLQESVGFKSDNEQKHERGDEFALETEGPKAAGMRR